MNKKINSLWVEKYRPTKIDDCLTTDVIKYSVQRYIDKNDMPNILLHGAPGLGKTTLAKLLVNNLNCSYLYINASDDRNIDTVREKITNFVSAASLKPLKIVILDEADYLNKESSQPALRSLIETYSATSRFIFTANYQDKIIDPLKDRLVQYKIEPPSKKDIKIYLAGILDKEEINFDPKDITELVNRYYPSIRSCVKNLQNMCDDNTFKINFGSIVNKDYLCNILDILKKPTKNSWVDIRQLLMNADIYDYTEFYKFLYDNVEEYAKDSYEEVVFQIADTMRWDNIVADKEIGISNMVLQILKTIKK